MTEEVTLPGASYVYAEEDGLLALEMLEESVRLYRLDLSGRETDRWEYPVQRPKETYPLLAESGDAYFIALQYWAPGYAFHILKITREGGLVWDQSHELPSGAQADSVHPDGEGETLWTLPLEPLGIGPDTVIHHLAQSDAGLEMIWESELNGYLAEVTLPPNGMLERAFSYGRPFLATDPGEGILMSSFSFVRDADGLLWGYGTLAEAADAEEAMEIRSYLWPPESLTPLEIPSPPADLSVPEE